MYFQYLIETVSLVSGNNTDKNLAIGDWVNNVDMLQRTEGGDYLIIKSCIIPLTFLMRSQPTTIFQAIE